MIPEDTPLGTIIVGNRQASQNYGRTRTGTEWYLACFLNARSIRVCVITDDNLRMIKKNSFRNIHDYFDVDSHCFDILPMDNEYYFFDLNKVVDEITSAELLILQKLKE